MDYVEFPSIRLNHLARFCCVREKEPLLFTLRLIFKVESPKAVDVRFKQIEPVVAYTPLGLDL